MTKENVVRIHRIYSVLLSIVIVISGICLIVACVDIYNSGDKPFSREVVAEAFGTISIPVYMCLVMTIIGIILDVVSPREKTKEKADKPYGEMLKKLQYKRDLSKCDDTLLSAIKKEQYNRRIHANIRAIVFGIASVIFLVYALNDNNFHQTDITGSMINAMYVLVPCLAVTFAYTVFTVYYNEKSLQREIELTKQAPAIVNIDNSEKTEVCNSIKSDKIILITRIALLIIGVGILIYGYVSGGTVDVLTKAVNICTECIGLG